MSATGDFFKNYPNPVFFETGMGNGDSIQKALDLGFKNIYSIELSEVLFLRCQVKFQTYKNIHLYYGDSRLLLDPILQHIRKPITFWLDAHCSGGETKGEPTPPLLEELDAIGRHRIKTHIILIDDVVSFNINEQLVGKILDINPKYKIKFEDGTTSQDILTATL